MSKRSRIFIGILLAYVIGVGWLMYRQLGDIDPRYRESAEESLVETAQLLAAFVEQASVDGALQTEGLKPVFQSAYARRFNANIFGFEKTRVELRLTVVDRAGKVVFDSTGRHVGEDHSKWNDIRLTLQGQYGARTTADTDNDPRTSVMFVAAPVRDRASDQIIGAVSVGKPVQSFGQFVEAARRKTLLVGATSVVAVLLLALIVSVWLVRPFGLIADYVRYVRAQRSFDLPRLGRRALGALGAAYDEMRDALAGRNYVADYVQTLTHEVKSPLSAIRGAAELLQEPMPDADRARFAANISREAQRIQELVDRMMELTALESRRHLDAPAPVALRPLLNDVVASVQPACAARGVRIELADRGEGGRGESESESESEGEGEGEGKGKGKGKGDDTDATVEGDAFLLHRAVANLVDNAIDFSPSGSMVTLSLLRHRRSVDLCVRDRGPGIPDYAEGKVFEKFYSLARPQTQKKSTGLGLSFVKEIAELHHGRVTLTNAADGGALAVLSLPTLDAVARS